MSAFSSYCKRSASTAHPKTFYLPHVGTDKLPQTVRAIREEIKSLGGEVRFNTQMTDLLVKNNAVCGVVAETNGVNETIETAHVILAIGHSARDTFKMLFEKSCVPM